MALLRFPNLAQTTLTGAGIGVGGASFTVASAAAFGVADFFVRVEHATAGLPDGTEIEFMRVTNVAGSTFTVTKGLGGTADQAHAAGSYCTAILIGEALTLGLVQQLLHASGGTTIFSPGGATGGQGVVTFSDTPVWAGLVTGAGLRDSRGVSGANLPFRLSRIQGTAFSFTSISGAFDTLVLKALVRSDQAGTGSQTVLLRFNGDSSAIYDYEQINVTNATTAFAGTVGQTGLRIGQAPQTGTQSTLWSTITVEIDFYANTFAYKNMKSNFGHRGGTVAAPAAGDMVWENTTGFWRSTAAITQIDVVANVGAFNASSIVALYAY